MKVLTHRRLIVCCRFAIISSTENLKCLTLPKYYHRHHEEKCERHYMVG
jgi:hypothetical protein